MNINPSLRAVSGITSATDICQNVFSLLTWSFSLSEIMMLLIQVFCCHWNSAGQAQVFWGKCWSHSSALMKSAVTATGTRVMARTSYFQNMFLWQKTEEGFHTVKMAMSYWWPLLKDGMLQWVIIFSCTSSYFTDTFFSSPVNMKNKLLNTKKPHPKHQSMSYVNMKNKWLNTKKPLSKHQNMSFGRINCIDPVH